MSNNVGDNQIVVRLIPWCAHSAWKLRTTDKNATISRNRAGLGDVVQVVAADCNVVRD